MKVAINNAKRRSLAVLQKNKETKTLFTKLDLKYIWDGSDAFLKGHRFVFCL